MFGDVFNVTIRIVLVIPEDAPNIHGEPFVSYNQLAISSQLTMMGHAKPSHLVRRGRCLADTERIMSLARPLAGSGVFARATAAAMSASTSGRANTSIDSRRMKRV